MLIFYPAAGFRRLPALLRSRICRCSPRASACWLWTGPLSYQGKAGDPSKGYGRQSWPADPHNAGTSPTNWLAHKLVYELLIGPVPAATPILDHLADRCTARRCVRPDHLEPVTIAENTRRGGGRFGGKRLLDRPKRMGRNGGPSLVDDEEEIPF